AAGTVQGGIWEIPALGGVPRRGGGRGGCGDGGSFGGRAVVFQPAQGGNPLPGAPKGRSPLPAVARHLAAPRYPRPPPGAGRRWTTCTPAGRRTGSGSLFSGETASGSTFSWRRPPGERRAS